MGSEVHVGRGIANIVAARPAAASRIAFFTQPSVAAITDRVAEVARAESNAIVHIRQLPDGDAAKRSNVVETAYEWLNSVSFTRDDFIVAVGGGALTDAVGFIAATYLRGVAVSYLPTTLLGAVDASIGGKTGINVGGKNLAGVFRHPRKVVVDLDVLDDLPPHLLVEGAAETVKAGFIADRTIVDAYEERGLNVDLGEVVPAAIAVKVNTVQVDFREAGLRAILNYGHTVGHAVETAAGIPHGHAVSIGMVAAGKIAEETIGFGGADRQRQILEKIGLPTISPAVDPDVIDTLMGRDKKRDVQGIRMVLLEDFGAPVVKHVTPRDLRRGLAEVGIE
jgi:3-dehydroquinate synthetase